MQQTTNRKSAKLTLHSPFNTPTTTHYNKHWSVDLNQKQTNKRAISQTTKTTRNYLHNATTKQPIEQTNKQAA